eukprot:s2415_g7.t2
MQCSASIGARVQLGFALLAQLYRSHQTHTSPETDGVGRAHAGFMRSPYGDSGWLALQSPESSNWFAASSSTFQSPAAYRSTPYAGIPLTLSAPPVDHYHTEWSYQPTHYSLVVAMINHWAQKLRRVSNHLRRETLAEAWQLWHDLIVEERLSKRLADAALLMRASDSPRPVQRRPSRPATRALRSPEATPSPSRWSLRGLEELPKIQVALLVFSAPAKASAFE